MIIIICTLFQSSHNSTKLYSLWFTLLFGQRFSNQVYNLNINELREIALTTKLVAMTMVNQ